MRNLAVLAALIVLFSGAAMAQMTYEFTYDGSDYQATGTLDVNGSGLAVSGSGILTYDNGTASTALTLFPINSVMAADPSGNGVRVASGTDLNGLDNLVFPGSSPLLDEYGLIFWTGNTSPTAALADTSDNHPNFGSAGGFEIYSDGGNNYSSSGASNSFYDYQDYGSFTLTPAAATPEPGAVSLLVTMLAGLVGLVAVRRLRLPKL